jgi:hypothetical protein
VPRIIGVDRKQLGWFSLDLDSDEQAVCGMTRVARKVEPMIFTVMTPSQS